MSIKEIKPWNVKMPHVFAIDEEFTAPNAYYAEMSNKDFLKLAHQTLRRQFREPKLSEIKELDSVQWKAAGDDLHLPENLTLFTKTLAFVEKISHRMESVGFETVAAKWTHYRRSGILSQVGFDFVWYRKGKAHAKYSTVAFVINEVTNEGQFCNLVVKGISRPPFNNEEPFRGIPIVKRVYE